MGIFLASHYNKCVLFSQSGKYLLCQRHNHSSGLQTEPWITETPSHFWFDQLKDARASYLIQSLLPAVLSLPHQVDAVRKSGQDPRRGRLERDGLSFKIYPINAFMTQALEYWWGRTNPVTLWNAKTFIYQTVLHRLQTRRNAMKHQISSVCFLGVYSNQQSCLSYAL